MKKYERNIHSFPQYYYGNIYKDIVKHKCMKKEQTI
jgi:hypothetical protein